MTENQRKEIIETITKREALRPLSRFARFLKDPAGTIPYYTLALLGHIKPFKITFKSLWGKPLTVYLPEGNTFYYYGYCEANLNNYFLRSVRDGAVCIDIGAHIGIYTSLLSKLVGEKGSVHSFEPTPWTFNLLKTNVGELKNVTVNNLAVSENKKQLEFFDYGPGYGAFNTAHKSGSPELHRQATKTIVESISLDTYCKEKNISPNIIKIDAEGFEADILKGMTKILTENKPVVTLEVAGEESWSANRKEAFTILEKMHYSAYEIEIDGNLKKHIVRDNYRYDNLVFIHDTSKP